MTPAHRSWIVFFDGRSKNLKRIDFGRCSRLQVCIQVPKYLLRYGDWRQCGSLGNGSFQSRGVLAMA